MQFAHMIHKLSDVATSDRYCAFLHAVMSEKPNRFEESNDAIAKYSNKNCIEEGIIDINRLCTRF